MATSGSVILDAKSMLPVNSLSLRSNAKAMSLDVKDTQLVWGRKGENNVF